MAVEVQLRRLPLPPTAGEIMAGAALVPLSVLYFELMIEGADLLRAPDMYALMVAIAFQSGLLLRSGARSRTSVAVRQCAGFAAYSMVEVLAGGWSFFYEAQHLLYGVYSLLFAALAAAETSARGRTLLILADSFVRATVPLTMYAACVAADRGGTLDFGVLNDTRANSVLLVNAALLGILLGFARASHLKTQAYLTDAIQGLGDGLVLFGPDQRVVFCNHAYAAGTGYHNNPSGLAGMRAEDVLRLRLAHGERQPDDFRGDVDEWVHARLRAYEKADGTPAFHGNADGHWIRSIKRRSHDGGVVAIYSDVTQLKRSAEAAQIEAQHDPLTGLPNRRLLAGRLALTLAHARRDNTMAAVLVIDLDGFKQINDTRGHQAGDEVLRSVASRLQTCLRETDTALRVGGDEFMLVLGGLVKAGDAGLVAAKLLDALAQPMMPGGAAGPDGTAAQLQLGASVGISLYPRDGVEPDQLVRRADEAMYIAKRAGGGYVIHNQTGVIVPQVRV